MTKTTNYQLNQWAKSDRVMMDDFNADNQKIDAALGTIPKLAVGTYTGDGAAENTITLGFKPQLMIIYPAEAGNGNTENITIMLLGDQARFSSSGNTVMVSPYYSGNVLMFDVTRLENGVVLMRSAAWDEKTNMNTTGKSFTYFAIG